MSELSSQGDLRYPVVVPGIGPIPAPGMIVGEAPGRNEIQDKVPFCGASGRLLDSALEAAGRDRAGYYVTNAFKGDVGVGNRNPTQEELEDHWPLLAAEIRTVQPRGILLLGRVATALFVPEVGRMGDVAGTSIAWEPEPSCCRLYPCWHPAYVLRSGRRGDFDAIVYNFTREVEIAGVSNPDGRPTNGVRFGNGAFTLRG